MDYSRTPRREQVRKFRLPPFHSEPELDLFHNPSLYLSSPEVFAEPSHRIAWLSLVKRCLRFAPHERPTVDELALSLHELIAQSSLLGEVEIGLGTNFHPARLLDGREAVVRIVRDN